jgi:hypothetical protein
LPNCGNAAPQAGARAVLATDIGEGNHCIRILLTVAAMLFGRVSGGDVDVSGAEIC